MVSRDDGARIRVVLSAVQEGHGVTDQLCVPLGSRWVHVKHPQHGKVVVVVGNSGGVVYYRAESEEEVFTLDEQAWPSRYEPAPSKEERLLPP